MSNTINESINTFWTRIIDLYDSYHDFTEKRVISCHSIMNNILEVYYKFITEFITDDYKEEGIWSHDVLFKSINDTHFKKENFKILKSKLTTLDANTQFEKRIIQHDNIDKFIKIRHDSQHRYKKRELDYSIYLDNYKVYDADTPGKLSGEVIKYDVQNDIDIDMTGLNITVNKHESKLSTCNNMITLSAGGNTVVFLGIIMCNIISPECFYLKYENSNNTSIGMVTGRQKSEWKEQINKWEEEKKHKPEQPKPEQHTNIYYYYNPSNKKKYIEYEYKFEEIGRIEPFSGDVPVNILEEPGLPFAYCIKTNKLLKFNTSDMLLISENDDNIKYKLGNNVFTYEKFPITGTSYVSIKKPYSGIYEKEFIKGQIIQNYLYNVDNMKNILLCALFSFKRVGDLVPETLASIITKNLVYDDIPSKINDAIGAYVDTCDFWAKLNGLLRGAYVISDMGTNKKIKANTYFYNKYLKYKNKYLELKKQISNTIL
jgi:hypothetical protein